MSAVVGTASDAISRANGDLLAAAWAEGGGTVLATVRWPEAAVSPLSMEPSVTSVRWETEAFTGHDDES